jgi:hypothetical protein
MALLCIVDSTHPSWRMVSPSARAIMPVRVPSREAIAISTDNDVRVWLNQALNSLSETQDPATRNTESLPLSSTPILSESLTVMATGVLAAVGWGGLGRAIWVRILGKLSLVSFGGTFVWLLTCTWC